VRVRSIPISVMNGIILSADRENDCRETSQSAKSEKREACQSEGLQTLRASGSRQSVTYPGKISPENWKIADPSRFTTGKMLLGATRDDRSSAAESIAQPPHYNGVLLSRVVLLRDRPGLLVHSDPVINQAS
jgi:hypothetical protein